jgi:hypothetical protein
MEHLENFLTHHIDRTISSGGPFKYLPVVIKKLNYPVLSQVVVVKWFYQQHGLGVNQISPLSQHVFLLKNILLGQ